ncbi:MAG: hypothetical protein M3Y87_13265 [Myxococcota bacterium]|nr:hypothetical protein [Myxococcota bacterium]
MAMRDAAITIGGSAMLAAALALGASSIGAPRSADPPPVGAMPRPSSEATLVAAVERDAGADLALASYVAFARDFARFREWERHPIAGAMMPIGAAPGPAFVYVSARASTGARRWPVGTILVKTVESGAPHQWTIHAMVKRGVPYNRDGAIGWEFFELALDEDGETLRIVWRGNGPPSGHGYAAIGRDAGTDPVPLVCNDCHAVAWQDDAVLTPALSLGH